jgi:hypothetical protein
MENKLSWFANHDVEAEVVGCGAPLHSLLVEDHNPGDKSCITAEKEHNRTLSSGTSLEAKKAKTGQCGAVLRIRDFYPGSRIRNIKTVKDLFKVF